MPGRRLQRRRQRHQQVAELDITAFMNLMVILVPFLLITAVFSRVAVVDLFLPEAGDSEQNKKPAFMLQLELYQDRLVVKEKRSDLRRQYRIKNNTFDRARAAKLFVLLKQRFPAQRQATLLAAGDISYDLLVSVMDLVRLKVDDGQVIELFPDISIGDAPVAGRAGRRAG